MSAWGQLVDSPPLTGNIFPHPMFQWSNAISTFLTLNDLFLLSGSDLRSLMKEHDICAEEGDSDAGNYWNHN